MYRLHHSVEVGVGFIQHSILIVRYNMYRLHHSVEVGVGFIQLRGESCTDRTEWL